MWDSALVPWGGGQPCKSVPYPCPWPAMDLSMLGQRGDYRGFQLPLVVLLQLMCQHWGSLSAPPDVAHGVGVMKASGGKLPPMSQTQKGCSFVAGGSPTTCPQPPCFRSFCVCSRRSL